MMNWYLAKIVYRIICGDGNHTAQFDEQLRLVQLASSSPRIQFATPLQIADRSRHLKRGLFFKPDGQRNCVELQGISAKKQNIHTILYKNYSKLYKPQLCRSSSSLPSLYTKEKELSSKTI